ncbi:hypothetical protein M9H77_02112 [Catharanthus roseus]|uniref:Uncharacterized protein n=1 Tax=Catharanthus roseus TaxID=4058 RepID=A0ACC0C7F6_CATRO|nr:hypothetical protein M9H77_02112 [Catharanthus roseus]
MLTGSSMRATRESIRITRKKIQKISFSSSIFLSLKQNPLNSLYKRDSGDIGIEGDRGLDSEPTMVGSLHISREDVGRMHGDNDDDDDDVDDDDDSVEVGGEEEPVPMALVAPITESRNKRPDKAHVVPEPTQRKKAKSSDWELTRPTDSVDLELIPLYRGHVAGLIWLGQTLSDPEQELATGQDLCIWNLLCSSTPTQPYYRLL